MLSDIFLKQFMYWPGVGQHRKNKEHKKTNQYRLNLHINAQWSFVTEEKQQDRPTDSTKGNNFCECESRR